MKLLAKTAEERYQTATGLEADLRRRLREWTACGHINPFPLGFEHEMHKRRRLSLPRIELGDMNHA
jgi:hypothetical protein